jgi:ABC-type branched-subunit amino acid transport system substrate-binding protein
MKLIAATDTNGATGRIRFDAKGDRLDPKIALYQVVAGAWVYQGVN